MFQNLRNRSLNQTWEGGVISTQYYKVAYGGGGGMKWLKYGLRNHGNYLYNIYFYVFVNLVNDHE